MAVTCKLDNDSKTLEFISDNMQLIKNAKHKFRDMDILYRKV